MPEDMPDRMPEDMPDRMPEDLPVTKCINVMVGITRSKVIDCICFEQWRLDLRGLCVQIGCAFLFPEKNFFVYIFGLCMWYSPHLRGQTSNTGFLFLRELAFTLQPLCHHLMHYWQPPRDLPNVRNDEIPGWLSTVWRYIALLCWGLSQSTISHFQPKQHTEMTGWLNR